MSASSFRRSLRGAGAWTALALGALATATAGCTTDAFCFYDCDGATTTTTGTGTGTGDGGGGGLFTGSTGEGGCFLNCGGGGAGGDGGCTPTNGGIEICDGLDNDCNGTKDEGFDFTAPQTCGTCANSCLVSLQNCAVAGIVCGASPDPGNVPGECSCTLCADDYFDLDGDGKTCEYYCVKVPGAVDDATCDNKDDDCDGVKDEDVDLCTSTSACGKCGGNCVVLHGTPECVHTGNMPCDASNTQCAIQACDCNGPGDCWWNLDNSFATGCEYQCDLTNGGVEICGDGLDNDCDGKIDDADDLSQDPQIGVTCFGDPDGECAAPAHAGQTICQGNQVACAGPNVLVENQIAETCNNADDDCDGAVDDSPTDGGGSCGQSNVFPCSFGTFQCIGGALTCIGAVDPQPETCNGVDDDCDGSIDKTGNNAPPDSVGACNVPVPPPAGATSACMAGTKACVAGGVVCQGSVTPAPGATDGCNVDANCDGVLTNQPNLQTDVQNCGSCGNNCLAGAVHSNWSCTAGACVFQGCQPGFYDLDNDQQCEYACTFVSATEACNGTDDDCDGQIDEGAVAPSPTQVCGVSPVASAPECTTGVTVACQNGAWTCTFPAGVCSPTCAGATEICDTLDNNCNGLLNENVPNYGKPCASDDGLPPPGHGACRTTGTFVCNGANAVACSATKADCAGLPGGCTELCDGIDNDCDGVVDETFNAKGSNAANFVKPTVTKIAASLWTYTYEASRPSSTSQAPGTGNGFWTSAPAGLTLDKTPACSVPNKIPWFNVTPLEVEQVCTQMGGAVCTRAQYQTACKPNAACTFGYNPRGAAGSACATGFTATKYCNLGLSFDFNGGVAGDQDGLLPTGSNLLQNCWADWSALQGNIATNNKLFDLTGNLREITKEAANQYKLMGGAFNTQSESGASCNFTFYTVDQNFKFLDTGYRCCFTSDPTL